jgi:hypothetical protein
LDLDLVFEIAISKTWPAWEKSLRTYLYERICFPNPSQLSKVIWEVDPWKTVHLDLENKFWMAGS